MTFSNLVTLVEKPGIGQEMTLSAPRANALEPELLGQIHRALDVVEATSPKVLVIRAGSNFCSGGDVARFYKSANDGDARGYAEQVVPALQDIVFRLVAMPTLVAVAARGAITGGGAGLLFAADLAAVHPDAFVQPYYRTVGFAPDGGWNALLPEKIGTAKARVWLLHDSRVTAQGLFGLGLSSVVDTNPEQAIELALSGSIVRELASVKPKFWNATRRKTLRKGLDTETQHFLDCIGSPETLNGMRNFLSGQKAVVNV